MGNRGSLYGKGNQGHRAGYEYLSAYKLTVVIYDYTVEFCGRWIDKFSRTRDQMIQAARSGTVNISEGYKQESLKSYIKLAGVARGSQEELLKDCMAYARQNGIKVWPAEKAKREIGEIREIWKIIRENKTLPNNPNFPALPDSPELAVNLLITLINQANLLIDRLIKSLKKKHQTEGGFTENLYRRRVQYRQGVSLQFSRYGTPRESRENRSIQRDKITKIAS